MEARRGIQYSTCTDKLILIQIEPFRVRVMIIISSFVISRLLISSHTSLSLRLKTGILDHPERISVNCGIGHGITMTTSRAAVSAKWRARTSKVTLPLKTSTSRVLDACPATCVRWPTALLSRISLRPTKMRIGDFIVLLEKM